MRQRIFNRTCRLRVAWLLGPLFIFGACAAESAGLPVEPVYDGKPLSYWVFGGPDAHLRSVTVPDGWLDEPGVEAVKNVGTNAIPFLLKWMESNSAPYALKMAFGVLGPTARSAIPDLTRLATNQPPPSAVPAAIWDTKAVRVAATASLALIGPDALPALCGIATNRNVVDARLAALRAVEGMGTNAMSAAGSLVFCLTDEDNLVVTATLEALKSVRSEQRELFLPILECLDSPDPQVRRGAAEALAPFADSAMPPLCRAATNDSVWFVRYSALEALASLGSRALPTLVQGLKDHNERVRYMALCVLVRADPQGLTNTCVLAIGAEGLLRSTTYSERRGTAALLLRAAGQQALGAKLDVWVPPRDGWEQVFTEATNALRRLAPQFLHGSSS